MIAPDLDEWRGGRLVMDSLPPSIDASRNPSFFSPPIASSSFLTTAFYLQG